MSTRPDTDDYARLLTQDIPMVDLRAPIEFMKGAFPTATNLPLMTDDERAKVGTCYKREGPQAAIRLGHQLVRGTTREERLNAWLAFARQHPEGYIYCFRGGLRSRTVQQWMREAGVDYPLVKGGYKALRRFCIDDFEARVPRTPLWVVAGPTGSGKTRVIQGARHAIDLEGLARHKGSSFGRTFEPQPPQITFENALAIDLMKLGDALPHPVLVEDESRLIGRCALPLNLRDKMAASPVIRVEEPFESRVELILEEYVREPLHWLQAHHADTRLIWDTLSERLLDSLDRIRKRLGGERHQRLRAIMQAALAAHREHDDLDGHREWIRGLLRDYYDPMYAWQMENKPREVVFQGSRAAIAEWLSHRN
ncbi:MAG: tRNA 2-selenouridine(34) synthase MnmH [Gammaproteobacteria bacterium]|nr:MAG: tRNA 2-selenouridine(34) synthase MnmH [Gammaproteobacteria bacterium]